MSNAIGMDYLEITTERHHPLHIHRTDDLPHARRSIYIGPFIGTREERMRQHYDIMPYNVEHRDAQRAHGLSIVYWPSINQAQMYRGRGSLYSIIRPADFAPYACDIAAVDTLIAAVPDPDCQTWFEKWPSTSAALRQQISMFDDMLDEIDAVCVSDEEYNHDES